MTRKSEKDKLLRHLDHLASMTSGVSYTSIPEPIRTLWFDGDMPSEKVRLLAIMLSHAEGFHIKSAYLRNRFHQRTITKYIKELIEDNVIRTAKVRLATGGYAVVYHTNRISEWDLREVRDGAARSSVNGSSVNGSSVNGSSVNGHNDPDLNEPKGNETKEKSLGQRQAAAPRQEISKAKLIGVFSMLYGQFAKKTVMTTLVDELDAIAPRELILKVAREFLDKEGKADLEWARDHLGAWKCRVREEMNISSH